MGTCAAGFLLLSAAVLGPGQPSGGDDYRVAATGAAREVARQLEALQMTFATIGDQNGRGLYQQTDKIQYALVYLRQQLKAKASREDLLIAFDPMDQKLTALLDELENFEKWDRALRMVARRVRAAEHDLHFALCGGDGTARQSQVLYRQTLVLLTRSEDMDSLIRYVFDEREGLKRWTSAMADVRREIVAFQKLQQNKAPQADLQKQLARTDQLWETLVGQLKQLPGDQFLLLQANAAQVDLVFHRLASTLGVKGRRAPLPNNLSQ